MRKPSLPAQSRAINWLELAEKEPPARRWAISGWLGYGHTTLLVGPGGIGKSLLAQQIASCLAIGAPFIDDVPAPARCLVWACEDEAEEIWRRQVAIARWLNAGLEAFAENLIVHARHGLDNVLMDTDRGAVRYTSLIAELQAQASDTGAGVVVLDNVAQLFAGNENDRGQVTKFMNALAGVLPGRAVLLLAHPAKREGSEFSGSSAWENVARTRLLLDERLPGDKPDQDAAPAEDVRFLARRKANYSTRDWRRFSFRDGVLVPDAAEAAGAAGGIVAHLRDQATDRVVLEALEKLKGMSIDVTESTSSQHFLPRAILDYKLGEGRTRTELIVAMRRLRSEGRIERAVVGKYPNRSPKFGLRAVNNMGAHK